LTGPLRIDRSEPQADYDLASLDAEIGTSSQMARGALSPRRFLA
jgi:hypothetical protein